MRWMTLMFVFLFPGLGTIGAVWTIVTGRVGPQHVALLVGMFILTGLGITVGYHRMATHRSFEAHPVVKTILLILGSMAVEGPAIEWVANHLKHHTYSDRPGDPHSPREGLYHAHWGWLTQFGSIEVDKYAAFANRDPIMQFVSKTFALWVTLGYVIPFLIWGIEGLIWGGLFRQFAVQNVTFAVNSVCHRFGKRPFNTGDDSTNNWVVGILGGILGLGEGWHNNHHAFPVSAIHGLRWWEFDLSGHVIRTLETLRLVKNVKRPDFPQIQRKLWVSSMADGYRRATTPLPN
jgi:stearoyl-CoA desaturase (Delta-9 desaturase)